VAQECSQKWKRMFNNSTFKFSLQPNFAKSSCGSLPLWLITKLTKKNFALQTCKHHGLGLVIWSFTFTKFLYIAISCDMHIYTYIYICIYICTYDLLLWRKEFKNDFSCMFSFAYQNVWWTKTNTNFSVDKFLEFSMFKTCYKVGVLRSLC